MNSILIIDDEAQIRMLLSRILELEGYEVWQAKDRATGLDALRNHDVQVVLCDVFLPDGHGVQMVPELKALSPAAKIILLTAHGNIPDGVQAIKNGAFDYIVKGDDNRKIIPLVSRAMDEVAAESKAAKNSQKTGSKASKNGNSNGTAFTANLNDFQGIIGESPALSLTIKMAQKVAQTDVCVLLTGETGTGKEIFAKSIHASSARKDKPFVAINCSAFSKELLESELFGHKAGSFTGAVKDKKGLFEEANGGTLFLDEIGEMEYGLQAKLLRALEEKEFIKVGDTKPTQVDIRIIAATNRDLRKEIQNNQFREDLYFRLSVFQLELPPLRERKGDVALLSLAFVQETAARMNKPVVSISKDCMRILESYSWPGNIRELKNVIERALIVCEDEILPNDLPVDVRLNANSSEEGQQNFDLASVERDHIAKILAYTQGNKTETARLLKIGLTTLYRKIEEYKL